MRCLNRLTTPALALLAAAATSCATQEVQPTATLTFEEHTLRMPLTVQPNGTVSLTETPPLVGRIDLAPILQAEGLHTGGARPMVVQVMVHYGRFYVVGDGFRSIWEITPQPGATTASYRPIPIPADAGAANQAGRAEAHGGAATRAEPTAHAAPAAHADPAAHAAAAASPASAARPVKDARLSLYGPALSSCLRLDRANGPPVFITPSGEAANACP